MSIRGRVKLWERSPQVITISLFKRAYDKQIDTPHTDAKHANN